MSYGWSAGDLLVFARMAKEIYDFYDNAPKNLRRVIERFHYVAEQLEDLSHVLKESGWKKYDRAPKLEEDLEYAQKFFDKYDKLSQTTGTSRSRIWDTTKLGLDQGKLSDIEAGLRNHQEAMTSFKMDVTL